MKKRKLKNLQVSHVSFVENGANQRKFFLTKSEEQPNFEKPVKVIKSDDEEKRLVYGIVYEPDAIDAHGDFTDAETIEKAAHEFMLKYRQIDKNHDFVAGVGEVVESYIAPADMELNGEPVKKGTWILTTKADEETWEAVKKGEFQGYSLAGVAETEVIEEEVTKTEEKQKESLFQLLKGFFNGQKQAEVVKEEETFLTVVEKAGKEISTPNMADIDAAIESLTNLKTRVTPSAEGAGSEEDNMNQEQLEALSAAVEKAVGPIKEELASVKKHLNLDEEKTEEDIKVEKAVEAATAPLREEIEALKKSQGISNQQDTDVIKKAEVKKSVWNGLL
ncbi:XkdF-like putative serine protease domain-containing protein [Bacillus sp. SM-B1]|uniref:XkdF-like putative serine protease domain-containing protein n=1 Tax=Bacillus sp. SM-B1 TaxID=2980102 RepID=UPI002949187D|nr:XkdF-like putative serine protease domain-containing protein [Bacillus sp. SM-B1]MDV6040355.1 XkdF-like putative serine protease domain-containing protein [Bacillus sp. SM-B1]